MRVCDVMHVDLVTCEPDLPIVAAVQRMAQRRVGCVLVVDPRGGLSGVLSERDVLRLVADRADLDRPPVSTVMTTSVRTAPPDAELAWVAHEMAEHSIRHLPIVEDGRAIGIISMRDLLDLSSKVLRHQGDAAARELLEAVDVGDPHHV
jgi:CBS domain-containing protein